MRLIDADALKEMLDDAGDHPVVLGVKQMLDAAPTIECETCGNDECFGRDFEANGCSLWQAKEATQ